MTKNLKQSKNNVFFLHKGLNYHLAKNKEWNVTAYLLPISTQICDTHNIVGEEAFSSLCFAISPGGGGGGGGGGRGLTEKRQSKAFIISTNLDQKSLESQFSIAICRQLGDKWQWKTLFLATFDPHSLIVKSRFDCHLSSVLFPQTKHMLWLLKRSISMITNKTIILLCWILRLGK